MIEVSGSEVHDASCRLEKCGLNRGAAGNVSARHGAAFLITPSGLDPADCSPADMVEVDDEGRWSGRLKPSSEWRIHRDIYRARPEAGAVIHTHSPFATALACLRADIPPFHYMIARFGGSTVRCARYATFGEQALSDAVIEALDGRCACLMANHGMVVFGSNLKRALALALELETLCEQYWRALQAGKPVLLDDAEMERVIGKFGSYGQ
ncbi:class II aldolase/adducin family protein [Methyloversatilis sp.]|uniref:class II aldolase/adducin family protein n=1 Tax=Methyloversatilis sp. TaxID=2569862 RepID=UPI0035AD79EA